MAGMALQDQGLSTTHQATSPIRVICVDDHALFRRGIRDVLEECADIVLVGEGATAEEAVALVAAKRPDVVLLDVMIPGGGIEAARQIAATHPHTHVIMLSVSDETDHIVQAIQAGACGYLCKEIAPDRLIEAIRRVHSGQSVLCPSATARVIHVLRSSSLLRSVARHTRPLLTHRERQVMALLVKGWPNRRIARHLVVSESTVKSHIHNMLQKTGARNRAELITWAMNHHHAWADHPHPREKFRSIG